MNDKTQPFEEDIEWLKQQNRLHDRAVASIEEEEKFAENVAVLCDGDQSKEKLARMKAYGRYLKGELRDQ